MTETETGYLPDYTPPAPFDAKDNRRELPQLAIPHLYQLTASPAHYQTKTDYQLVSDYLQGDNQAFNEIILRHHRTLYTAARRYASNQLDAEDILQEALLRASRYLEKYRGDCKLRTWLYRLVINAAYDHAHRSYSQEYVAVDDPDFESECTKQLSHDPLACLADVITVSRAVNELPTEHREAIVLVDYEGYNVEQVAHMKQTKPGTIKSRRARAKSQLKDLLGRQAS